MAKTAVKEKKLIKGKDANHFWCYIHMEDMPLSERSEDPRYCQACYDFLAREIEVLSQHGKVNKKVWWWPKGYVVKKFVPAETEKPVAAPVPDRHQTQRVGVEEVSKNSNSSKNTNGKTSKRKGIIFGHPGRPRKSLPEKLIKKSRLSVRELAKRYGVSKSTISSIKNGQRVLV